MREGKNFWKKFISLSRSPFFKTFFGDLPICSQIAKSLVFFGEERLRNMEIEKQHRTARVGESEKYEGLHRRIYKSLVVVLKREMGIL